MATVNLTNGLGRSYDADEVRGAAPELAEQVSNLWPSLLETMDSDTRERVHGELAPCSHTDFLARYLELASAPLVIG